MTRKQLIDKVSRDTTLPKDTVKSVFTAITDNIVETVLSGNEVSIYGFGKFYQSNHNGRETMIVFGEPKKILPKKNIKFSLSRYLFHRFNRIQDTE